MALKRTIVFSATSQPLAIEYPPLFKIYPCPEDFPKPTAEYGHYPHFLDYYVQERTNISGITEMSYSLDAPPTFEELQTFPIPDSLVQSCDAADLLDEILDVVSALTSREVIRYGNYQAWFTELGVKNHLPQYGQEFFHHPDTGSPTAIEPTPKFEYVDEIAFRLQSEGGTERIVRMQELFESYFSAPEDETKMLFRDACRIAARAGRIATFDLSTSFVLLISSIESLIHIWSRGNDDETCKECGQVRYRVMQKFRDFVDEFGFEIENKVKSRLYGLRSALVHRGQLLPLDQRPRFYVETAEDLKRRYEATLSRFDYDLTRNLVNVCFRTFLYSELGRDKTQD